MLFNHYGGEAAQLAADLVNTPAPWTPDEFEPLLVRRGLAPGLPDATEIEAAWEWRGRLAPCFGAQDLGQRCAIINTLLDEAASRPYISLHKGPPHLHYAAEAAGRAARLRAVTAAGLSYVVCFASADRLGRCHRAECSQVFVDTSRNGRRSYCSLRCANTDAVRRHRAQQRSQPRGVGKSAGA
ncbi:CGNR zinc finger domain-containing protein [Streptomyces sp. NPDC020412]|uniref:CGNR zinc finger domain-containing protein n=1 Tax=Streptomyces sp. NPDC020412 TaxID=3365073 RepID=UPI0037AB0EDB